MKARLWQPGGKAASDPGDGSLWEDMTSYERLWHCHRLARRGKRHSQEVSGFELDLEGNLWQLHRELRGQTYEPGPYRTKVVMDSKRRMISAAPYRDRIVHHALTSVLDPIFDPRFIHDSYACRKGKGTHAAVRRFQHFARAFPHVLRCDIRKYFPSVDHEILLELLGRRVQDEKVRWLARLVVERSNPQLPMNEYFPGDDLFTPFERKRGLPIGNQTSQFFGNLYLDPLDHFIKDELGIRGYLRYVDDFAVFGESKKKLWELKGQIQDFLNGLRLLLHPRKANVRRTRDTNTFLGFGIRPHRIRVARGTVIRFRRRLKELRAGYREGQVGLDTVRASISGWIGHVGHADSWRLREMTLEDARFSRG